MSTKLYYGLRTVPMDMWELQAKVRELAKSLLEMSLAMFDVYSDDSINYQAQSILAEGLTAGIGIWEHEGRFLVYPEGEKWVYKALLDQPWLEEYGYWDNADWPDGMTEEEWSKRRDAWETCVEYGQPMNQGMFWITLVSKVQILAEHRISQLRKVSKQQESKE